MVINCFLSAGVVLADQEALLASQQIEEWQTLTASQWLGIAAIASAQA
jgi:hypothetical protein